MLKQLNLDPEKISEAEFSVHEWIALNEFLKNKHNDNIWLKNQKYHFITTEGINYVFCFTKSLLRRKRGKEKDGERFEIFDLNNEPLGQGGYGAVYPILGTIKFEANKPILKTNKKRVVKIEEHDKFDRSVSVLQEYNNLVHAGHLSVKPPVFNLNNGKKSLLVMKKAPGLPLEMLLNPTTNKNNLKLTVEQRLEITFAILNAVNEQVIEKKLIHRDLKPSNMLIELNPKFTMTNIEGNELINSPSKVTIIDYGHAIKGDLIENRRVGTTAYRAPELYMGIPSYTQKSDAYAVGRILSYLWGDDYKNYYFQHKTPWDEIKRKNTNSQLFSNPEITLFNDDEKRIRECLNGLLKEKVEDRWSIKEATQEFLKIDPRKYQLKKVQLMSRTELKSYEKAVQRQIQKINSLILRLSKKGDELIEREFKVEGKKAIDLAQVLKQYTEKFAENPDPILLHSYRRKCFKKIDVSKDLLQNHRDSRWIVAEVITAIGLLGIGYLFALGINYQITGRVGLFSQTKSAQCVENIRNSIYQLS